MQDDKSDIKNVDIALEKKPLDDKTVLSKTYTWDDFRSISKTSTIQNLYTMVGSIGFDFDRKNNVHLLGDTIVFCSGNIMNFFNMKTLSLTFFHGVRGCLGCVAIHPSKNYLAFGEKYIENPNIYVLKYPSMEIFKLLQNGSQKSYYSLVFNADGTKLASVGNEPDYYLSIWDWNEEKIVLKYKAFSQDVYNVLFHPTFEGRLTTSGMGHIKFWTISSTFTGLKLQGQIGKFGSTELTDIESFVHLADGKVLSSTETGNLLLWEGGFIKCEIGRKEGMPCHNGPIHSILLEEGEIITGGSDGFVRVWDYEGIDNADSPDMSTNKSKVFEIQALDELFLGRDVIVKDIKKFDSENSIFLITDSQGLFWKLNKTKRTWDKIHTFPCCGITSFDSCLSSHVFASLYTDGSIKIISYKSHTILGQSKYNSAGTYLIYAPKVL
jgi:WD40 repeat protein